MGYFQVIINAQSEYDRTPCFITDFPSSLSKFF